MSFKLPNIIKTIASNLDAMGAKCIVVGGSVRDFYLKKEIKDYDIEVYGLDSLDSLQKLLSHYGSVNLVGKSFGVLKFRCNGFEYDFSFPRTESKVGQGHKGFDVKVDGSISFREASKRRDFSINAMGYDIQEGKFLDPYNGMSDLKNKLLKHIDDKTFQEDPLRVYRAIQFCARFEFRCDEKTLLLCKKMVDEDTLLTLPKERVLEELKKLFFKASKPSIGFELMKKLGILKHFRELDAVDKDAWARTMQSLDAMKRMLVKEDKTNLVYMLSIVCSEFKTPKECESFILRLSDETKLLKSVLNLLKYASQVSNKELDDTQIKTLATKVKICELITFLEAKNITNETLKQKAKALGVYTKPLDAVLQGRDLISLGLKPSPEFKKILDAVYELQLNAKITSKHEALEYIGSLTK
ncbi:MAG: CCA tRNA nucleotidyltransferase [Epsilonproteobacteria bacterium]|nr:CCA tRNA nucleotidyltransferase [Campylobacterota bacterium]